MHLLPRDVMFEEPVSLYVISLFPCHNVINNVMTSVWSGMCLLHSTPALAGAPGALASVPLVGGTPVNLQLLVTTIYVVTYVLMDPVAGSLAAGMVLFLHKWTFGETIL